MFSVICLLSMFKINYSNNKFSIFDQIEQPVVTDSISIVAFQFAFKPFYICSVMGIFS